MQLPSKIIVWSALLVGLVACGKKLATTDIQGVYRAEYPYGVETLIVNSDGTYEQSFRYKDGKELNNKGVWQFSPVTENSVRLRQAFVVDDGFGKPASPAKKEDWVIGARRNAFTGSISLRFNDDLGVVFQKDANSKE